MASSKYQGQRSERGFMEIMKAVKGFQEDEEDDEDDYVKQESSSRQGDVGVKVDAKGNEQRANTPRSKHSATEQRRRSKINDRFQLLRQLIPRSDQKRDKASFLLEVIEYIQVLQEKVLKYEAAFPGWNQDTMKFMPWEELAIEGGTIRVSNVYSQGLLNSLAQALQSLGIDLSQASVSVQIDLGKRAINRPPTTTSSSKDHEEPSSCNWAMEHSRVASSGEDSDQVNKRLRTDNR
eukprot:TRINITY_DN5277_c0_g1_i1.p1 TRINITY_DN5277_c0_g1~~TRINITY_DN5277_c0_g1_i1.p1  ORF type:complete len:270 (+),score=65.24 TRINITY_DN5277_c0_g1_i1:104-811(+)